MNLYLDFLIVIYYIPLEKFSLSLYGYALLSEEMKTSTSIVHFWAEQCKAGKDLYSSTLSVTYLKDLTLCSLILKTHTWFCHLLEQTKEGHWCPSLTCMPTGLYTWVVSQCSILPCMLMNCKESMSKTKVIYHLSKARQQNTTSTIESVLHSFYMS